MSPGPHADGGDAASSRGHRQKHERRRRARTDGAADCFFGQEKPRRRNADGVGGEKALGLTIMLGIAVLALLIVLAWALGQIARAIDGIVTNLQNIAMGVRAIERETEPLAGEVTKLNETFTALDGGFDSVANSLTKLAQ